MHSDAADAACTFLERYSSRGPAQPFVALHHQLILLFTSVRQCHSCALRAVACPGFKLHTITPCVA